MQAPEGFWGPLGFTNDGNEASFGWGDWSLYADAALRAFESDPGVQAPKGPWDPHGFTNDGGEASFLRRHSVEFKHGRFCMLATVGYITPEITGTLPCCVSKCQGDIRWMVIARGARTRSALRTSNVARQRSWNASGRRTRICCIV